MSGEVLNEALAARRRGWSVIDLPHASKNPARNGWQNERLNEESLTQRFSIGPRNLGVLLGEASAGLADVDLDCLEARAVAPILLAPTQAVFGRPGSPRSHFLFYATEPLTTMKFNDPTATDEERSMLLELRSTGCQTLLPGSVHPSGEVIAWHQSGEPPSVESEVLIASAKRCAAASLLARRWPSQGSRQDAALALAGGLLRTGMDSGEAADFIKAVAVAANDEEAAKRMTAADFTAARIGGSLPTTGWPHLAELVGDAVVAKVAEWLGIHEWRAGSDSGKLGKPSQADELVAIGKRCLLFHDSRGAAMAGMPIQDHLETWPLGSRTFKNWLRHEHYKATKKAASNEAVSTAVATLEGIAAFEGETYELGNRVARQGDTIHYDLGNANWEVVTIEVEGVRTQRCQQPLFRRYAHQQAQVSPSGSGDPWLLFDFLNVKEEHRLLLLVWLIVAVIPDIPHPILNFYGEKGAGKSVGQKVLRAIIDPSVAPSLTFPRDISELAQQLSHHYAPIYDNLDGLAPWLSDCLCRAVTGEGFTKRELYTNDDDIIYAYRRVILLNGINISPRKPDLLDRSILIELLRITRLERQAEQGFWADFQSRLPDILAGIFSTLSRAIRLYKTVSVDQLERMADFTRWGAAVAEALGHTTAEFLNAYRTNLEAQNQEAVEGNLIASAILKLMEARSIWSGSPTSLLLDLEDSAVNSGLVRRAGTGRIESKSWPGGPQILTRRINEVKSNLLEVGIEIHARRDKERTIDISWLRSSENSDGSDGSVDTPQTFDANDATDATFPTSSPHRLVI